MRFCRICGQSNQDDAQFCEACGTGLNPVGAQPSTPAEPPATAAPTEPVAYSTPVEAPPTAPPAYAPPLEPPAYAPPAYAQPAPTPYYGAPAPVSAPAPSASKTWMPVIVALVVVALGVGGYFAYTALNPSKPAGPAASSTLTAADYKTKALQSLDAFDAAYATDISSAMTDLGSTDPQAQSAARATFDTFKQSVRDAAAAVMNLKPPAEYQSLHARLTKGLEANNTILSALDVYVTAAMAAQGDPTALAAAEQAYSDAISAPDLASAMTDFDAARAELKSGTGSTVTTP